MTTFLQKPYSLFRAKLKNCCMKNKNAKLIYATVIEANCLYFLILMCKHNKKIRFLKLIVIIGHYKRHCCIISILHKYFYLLCSVGRLQFLTPDIQKPSNIIGDRYICDHSIVINI